MSIQDRIDTLKAELNELEAELNKPTITAAKPVSQPGWPMVTLPEKGTEYYTIEGTGYICESFWSGDNIDYDRFTSGNVFATKADAEAGARRVRATQLLRKTIAEVTAEMAPGWVPDWLGVCQLKCHLIYRHGGEKWSTENTFSHQLPCTLYFPRDCGPEIIRRMGDKLDDLL